MEIGKHKKLRLKSKSWFESVRLPDFSLLNSIFCTSQWIKCKSVGKFHSEDSVISKWTVGKFSGS